MITIDLNPSQYRVVPNRGPNPNPSAVSSAVSSTARASRMSQSPATATATKPLLPSLPDNHPIYGIVNLALLSVSLYLLWANFL